MVAISKEQFDAAKKADAENGPLAKGALTSDEPQD